MTPGPATVVKLGGSVLTRKAQDYRTRPKVIHRLASECASSWDHREGPWVLLHGAGSFGHPPAAKWGLARPPGGERAHRERGAAITLYQVRRLHQEVLRALLDAGLPAVSVAPFGRFRNRAGKLEAFEVGPFRSILEAGMLPVSFGDVVLDEDWGTSILSADTLAERLAQALPASRVLFVSDVGGVLEGAPGGPRRVLPRLTPRALEALRPPASGRDVTGGIRRKAEAMLAIAEGGRRVGLINGLQHGLLSRALRGEDVHGTWVG